jgi:hypothetical protein
MLCEELGLSQARLAQIRKLAPTAERALFAVGPVEIWIPERWLGDGQWWRPRTSTPASRSATS